jgi:hypothetical protein
MNCVSGITARVNRELSGSGSHVPTLARGADDLTAADAGAAVIALSAAAPAPASPADRRKVRLFGPFGDWGDEPAASQRHMVIPPGAGELHYQRLELDITGQ